MKTIDEYEKLAKEHIFIGQPDGFSVPYETITQTTTQLIMIDLGKYLVEIINKND